IPVPTIIGARTITVLTGSEIVSLANAFTVFAAPCVSVPGVVSWWRAEGNANDTAGANHGTLVNGATFGPGFVGEAFLFDGVDDHVRVPATSSLMIANGFTVEGWFNPTVTIDPSTPYAPALFSKGPDEMLGNYNSFGFENEGGRIEITGISRPNI